MKARVEMDRSDINKGLNARMRMSDEDKNVPQEYINTAYLSPVHLTLTRRSHRRPFRKSRAIHKYPCSVQSSGKLIRGQRKYCRKELMKTNLFVMFQDAQIKKGKIGVT
jgi:hypothetical protein